MARYRLKFNLSDGTQITAGDFDVMDGKTPVKGKDYFDEADINEIVRKVIETMSDGAPVKLLWSGNTSNYGFENHADELNGQLAWVLEFSDRNITAELTNGKYKSIVTFNGKDYEIKDYGNTTKYMRAILGTAGIKDIEVGKEYAIAITIYDAETNKPLYYTYEWVILSRVNSEYLPAVNVELPTEGIKKVTVDTSTVFAEGIRTWIDGAVTRLFDGNTTSTKFGGDLVGTTADVYFSLAEPTTLTYYTLYTGRDTTSRRERLPSAWTLYGKVNGEWVALSVVGVGGERSGIEFVNSAPFSYKIDNLQHCTDYKISFISATNQMQLNEMELYRSI